MCAHTKLYTVIYFHVFVLVEAKSILNAPPEGLRDRHINDALLLALTAVVCKRNKIRRFTKASVLMFCLLLAAGCSLMISTICCDNTNVTFDKLPSLASYLRTRSLMTNQKESLRRFLPGSLCRCAVVVVYSARTAGSLWLQGVLGCD